MRIDATEWLSHLDGARDLALAGDIHMPNGVMYEGAYFWRPADVPHGAISGGRRSGHALIGSSGMFLRLRNSSRCSSVVPAQ